MRFRSLIKSLLPKFLENRIHVAKEKWRLNKIDNCSYEVKNLRSTNSLSIQKLFNSPETEEMWRQSKKKIESFGIEDAEGGINPGDRKAVYYLVNELKPSSVLEVGTHIGASTVYIASSLYMKQIKNGMDASLTTVDIIDVNSTEKKQWLEYGINFSPLEMIKKLDFEAHVNFVADNSLDFATKCDQKFDFIFLDGNHRAQYVYQEIPKMLDLLNKNGIILFHDYYPNSKPLWSNNKVIPGPFLATKRLMKEGTGLTVVPLGKLPWKTKLDSNVSSLALLMRDVP